MYLHSWEAGSSHLVASTYAQDGGKNQKSMEQNQGDALNKHSGKQRISLLKFQGNAGAVPSPPICLEKEKKESTAKYFQSMRNSTGNTACRDPSASPEGAFARSCHSIVG